MSRLIYMMQSFVACQRGAVVIIFAFLLNALLVLLALSLDLSRGYLARSNMGGASDAAALAAAITENEADAEKYFKANLPDGQYGIQYDYDDDVAVTFNPGERTVTVAPSDFGINAYFHSADNSGSLQVANKSVVGTAGATVQPVDYFLILDESGSMDDFTTPSPVTGLEVFGYMALRHSVQMMIDEVYNTPSAAQHYSMSFSGYSTVANGTSGLEADPLVLHNILPDYTGNYNDENGWTCAACGLDQAFGYYNTSQPARQKVYILMTDGEFNTLMAGGQNIPLALQEAMDQCAEIKAAASTTIWAIGFGNGSHGSDVALKSCASTPDHYVYAPDGIALGAIFKKIAQIHGKLRIVE